MEAYAICARLSNVKYYLEYKQRYLGFCTLATGVAKVSRKGTTIVGRWKDVYPGTFRVRTQRVLPRFANWSSEPDRVVRFTKVYGPLTVRARGRGRSFSFGLDDWQRAQREFKAMWDKEIGLRGRRYITGHSGEFETERGEEFSLWRGQWSYVTATLYRLLYLELLATPPERLRKCPRQDCKTPYFIARHLRERYCSRKCAAGAQRQSKLRWWRATGEPRRQEAAQHTKGKAKR